jgi:phosphatidylglycerophosphate synthase
MLDRRARQLIGPPLERVGSRLASAGVHPGLLTAAGLAFGAGAAVAAALRLWPLALVLWLSNRAADGLDGPVARARGATELGGFFDIVADFSVYGGFVVGVAVGVPAARLACLVLLLTYYVSGTAFLALSSLLERCRARGADERSLHFVGGLAEGTETVAVYVLFCLLPQFATPIAWVFAAAVGITALQRVVIGAHLLRSPVRTSEPSSPMAT